MIDRLNFAFELAAAGFFVFPLDEQLGGSHGN
jgi:hypothetical protein